MCIRDRFHRRIRVICGVSCKYNGESIKFPSHIRRDMALEMEYGFERLDTFTAEFIVKFYIRIMYSLMLIPYRQNLYDLGEKIVLDNIVTVG